MTKKVAEGAGLIFIWSVANLLGVACIGVIRLIPVLTSIPGRFVSSLLIGLPIGLAQWIVLRRVSSIPILWILSISTGLILGIAMIPTIADLFWGFLDDESIVALTAAPTTIGFFVGLVQLFFLRGSLTKSFSWLLSSALGLGLGSWLVLVTNLIDRSGVFSIFLVTLVYASLTGFALSRMPVSNNKDESTLIIAS